MTVEEMNATLRRAYSRVERFNNDGGTYEEMCDGYQFAFDLVAMVAEEALEKLSQISKKDSQ